jgi:Tfp pilus assembly protein PilN
MKKFNLVLVLLTLLFFASVGGYIYFLEGLSQTKKLQSEIASLQRIKENIQKPVIQKADFNELSLKESEYKEILQKLGLNANISIEQTSIKISGAISDTYSYMMVKRMLAIVKNDSVTLENLCMGVGCNEYEYGFFVKFEPYVLKYR